MQHRQDKTPYACLGPLVDVTEPSWAESMLRPLCEQVLVEVFKSPVECYVICPGPIPLFQGRLPDLTAESADDAQHLLRQFGVAVLPVRLPMNHRGTYKRMCHMRGHISRH